jgi:hypothetical protein
MQSTRRWCSDRAGGPRRPRPAAGLLALAWLAWLAGTAGSARAEDDVSSYRTAVERGSELFARGDYPAARLEFQRAYRVHPAPVLLFNIASTYRREGNGARARAYYEEFLRRAPADDPRAELARKVITELAEDLDAGRSASDAREDSGSDRRSGRRDPQLAMATAPTTATAHSSAAASGETAAGPELHAAPRAARSLRWTGIGAIGVGTAALGVGLWQASTAHRTSSAIEDLPQGSTWDQALAEKYARGKAAARRAVVFGVTGAGLVVTGVTLYLLGRRQESRAARPRAEMSLDLQAGRAVLGVSGRF